MVDLVLLGNERRDAGLEKADSTAEEDESDDEGALGTTLIDEDGWDGRDENQDVANRGQTDSHVDGLELSPVLVGNPAALQKISEVRVDWKLISYRSWASHMRRTG